MPESATDGGASMTLVMKGGGVKGIAHLGALSALADAYQFDSYAGTSAGAMVAAFLSAGFSVNEAKELMLNTDFGDLVKSERFRWLRIFLHQGLYTGTNVTKWMDETLAKKLHSPTRVTFSQLPHELRIYACRRDTDFLLFDSAKSHSVAVAYAVRCSMSIPFFFTPEREQGMRVFDGGLRNNYPVQALLGDDPSADFIGLYLGSETYASPKDSIWSDLLNIATEATDVEALRKFGDKTVIIDTRPISTLTFDLDAKEKRYLLECGRLAALKFLARRGIGSSAKVEEAKKAVEELLPHVKSAARKRKWWRGAIVAAYMVLSIGSFFAVRHLFAERPPSECYPRHPDTGRMDNMPELRRSCLFGRLTYVKWKDPNKHNDEWPTDVPNRVLTLARVDAAGHLMWSERNLKCKDCPAEERWTDYHDDWIEVVPSLFSRLFGHGGRRLVLRRDKCHGNADTVRTLEYSTRKEGKNEYMCLEEVEAKCREGWPIGTARSVPPNNVKFLKLKKDAKEAVVCFGSIVDEGSDDK